MVETPQATTEVGGGEETVKRVNRLARLFKGEAALAYYEKKLPGAYAPLTYLPPRRLAQFVDVLGPLDLDQTQILVGVDMTEVECAVNGNRFTAIRWIEPSPRLLDEMRHGGKLYEALATLGRDSVPEFGAFYMPHGLFEEPIAFSGSPYHLVWEQEASEELPVHLVHNHTPLGLAKRKNDRGFWGVSSAQCEWKRDQVEARRRERQEAEREEAADKVAILFATRQARPTPGGGCKKFAR